MKVISPSLLSIDFFNIENALKIVEKEGINHLHLDVMDGNFVGSISFGMPVISSLRKRTNMIFDVHMMVIQPERYIKDISNSGADMISFHYEATNHHDRVINFIKEENKKAGIVLNPATPINVLDNIIYEIDYVLIMSVNPGFGGQKFIPYAINKVIELDRIRKDKNLNFKIEIDGGICVDNIKSVADAGADVLITGSAIFNGDIKNNINNLKKSLFI